jgi:hypothetical protein
MHLSVQSSLARFLFVLLILTARYGCGVSVFYGCTCESQRITKGKQKKTPKAGIEVIETYLPSLRSYLERGAFHNTFETVRSQLRPTTVTSYISFVHKYLEVLVGSMKKRKVGMWQKQHERQEF